MADESSKPEGPVKGPAMYSTETLRSWPGRIMVRIDGFKEYEKEEDLKYGANPGHAAAVFNPQGNVPLFTLEKTGKGGPSQNNYEDIDRALRIIRTIGTVSEKPAVAVMKHVNPTGVAMHENLLEAFIRAWDADARAAYGSTVVFNRPVSKQLLDDAYAHIKKRDPDTFIDVMAAPKYESDALESMQKKKAIRMFTYNEERLASIDPFARAQPELKPLLDGRVIAYEPYFEAVSNAKHIDVRTKHLPSEAQLRDLFFAWYVVANVRSNGVDFARDTTIQAIGTGKQERIDAIEDAIRKARNKAKARGENPDDCLRGSVMASDGFIPNIDNVEALKMQGVTAVIHPGGSKVADESVINACNDLGIVVAFTNWRCFSHH